MNLPACVNVCRGIDQRLGGTSVAIPAFVKATGDTGRVLDGLVVLRPRGDRGDIRQLGMPANEIYEIPWDSRSPASVIHAYHELGRIIRGQELLHVHGIWQFHTAAATHIARQCRIPYIISVHGMLDPWA